MITIKIHVDERLARAVRGVRQALRWRRVILLAALLLVALPVSLMAAPVSLPNEFSAGTPASASQVNANFEALATGLNDTDARLVEVETARPVPSAMGLAGYVTTTNTTGAVGSSFNSAGGSVSVSSSGGFHTVTFEGLSCVSGGDPAGFATVVPYIGSFALACRISSMSQVSGNCQIGASCFDSSGTARAGAIGLTYVR